MIMCLTRIWWRAQTSQDLNYSLTEIDLRLGTKCATWTLFWSPFWEKLPWYLHFRAQKLDPKRSGRTDTDRHGHTYERTHMIFWSLPYTISPSGNKDIRSHEGCTNTNRECLRSTIARVVGTIIAGKGAGGGRVFPSAWRQRAESMLKLTPSGSGLQWKTYYVLENVTNLSNCRREERRTFLRIQWPPALIYTNSKQMEHGTVWFWYWSESFCFEKKISKKKRKQTCQKLAFSQINMFWSSRKMRVICILISFFPLQRKTLYGFP